MKGTTKMTNEELKDMMEVLEIQLWKKVEELKGKQDNDNYYVVEEYIKQYEVLQRTVSATIGYVVEEENDI